MTYRANQQTLFQSIFSVGSRCEQFWRGQGCPLFDVVHPVFPLLTTTSPIFQDALKDHFGEAVVACDMPKPCKLPSPDSCQKRFLWTHKEVDLAPHPVSGPVLQVGETEIQNRPPANSRQRATRKNTQADPEKKKKNLKKPN